MKTTDEIILDLGLEYKINPYLLDQVKLAMQIYAQSAIDEIKEKIAEEAVRGFVKQFQAEFSDMNFEYMDFAADRFLADKESIRSVTIELK